MSEMLSQSYPPQLECPAPIDGAPDLSNPGTQAEIDQLETALRPACANAAGSLAVAGESVVTAVELEQIRRDKLTNLDEVDKVGFEGKKSQYEETVDMVAAIGFPVDNFRSFVQKPNKKDDGTEHTLASWHYGHGSYTVHDLLVTEITEERLATAAHESAHANTPRLQSNANFYGGEAERLRAAEFVEAVADQSLKSDKMLDGYHRLLATQLKKKQITRETFIEETSAILSELALVNRGKLYQVQEQQRKWHENQSRKRRFSGKPAPSEWVELVTPDAPNVTEPVGIDRTLVSLLEGINSQDELIAHVDNLKQRFYGREEYAVSRVRYVQQNPNTVERILIDYSEAEMAHLDREWQRKAKEDDEMRKKDNKRQKTSAVGGLAIATA